MKIMIDTNIFLDVLLDREGLADSSAAVLEMCEKRAVSGYISASCVTDIFYIVRKNLHSTDAAYNAVGNVLRIADVCPVSGEEVAEAFDRRVHDFEDCLLAVCAKNNGCECIITRNKKDYSALDVNAVSPEEFIGKI